MVSTVLGRSGLSPAGCMAAAGPSSIGEQRRGRAGMSDLSMCDAHVAVSD